VQILGISFDTQEANAGFAKKFNYNFPLLCDTDRKIGLAYGATDDPRASTAKRISYLIGADGKVKKAYATVKPAEHPAEVLQDA
jgi:peroxiredoxin Q/BCP